MNVASRIPMRTAVRAVAQPSSKRIACRTAIRFSSSSSTPQTPQSSEPQPPQTPQPPQPPQPKASSSKPSRVKAALLSAASPDQPDVKPVGTSRDPYAVPPLNRPLGSPKQPTSVPKTWAQKKEELLDRDRHKAKRKALLKEASQGYFHDYNLAKKANGGKLWVAPPVLIREDRSLYFPDISGKALTGSNVHTTDLLQGKVSLVAIQTTRVSEEHVQSFVEPVIEDWEGQVDFQYVIINHQANPLKSMLLSFFVSSLKRTVPESRWPTYICSSGEWNLFDVTRPLGIENQLLGYVYLVDENCKIRWAGCATAESGEAESLRKATAVLMKRLRAEKDGK